MPHTRPDIRPSNYASSNNQDKRFVRARFVRIRINVREDQITVGLGHGRSFGWLAVGWLVGWWVGGLVDWLVGWLVGWVGVRRPGSYART